MSFKDVLKKAVEIGSKAYEIYGSGCDRLEAKITKNPNGMDGVMDNLVAKAKPATLHVAEATKDMANKITAKVKLAIKKGEK